MGGWCSSELVGGRMGWVYGRILGRVGGIFVVRPDLRGEMALRLDSDMIFGVGIWPLRKLVLLAHRMLLLWL